MTGTIIFEAASGEVGVREEKESIWLTQRQMADLFQTSPDNIGLHLKNIYSEEELVEAATTEDFSVVQEEGGRKVRRPLGRPGFSQDIGSGPAEIVTRHTQTFLWRQSHDEGWLTAPHGTTGGLLPMLDEVRVGIVGLKANLTARHEARAL
ncbi:MAG: hypothetical protein LBQ81_06465 [Zoogloeaceae bacterium]|jgi:hypothetical protein|nr:hypothetical protein [Zoogloeaceae bacterium]